MPWMALSKDANSGRKMSDPALMANGGLPKEICSRVRKACNRCRLRKVKCDGRVPCTRCEQDHATCKLNYDQLGLKDLRKSYIASLEEQQVTLLSALRDLHRKAPDNRDVCDTVVQLQHKGFDIESLRFKDPHRASHKREISIESASPRTRPDMEPWEPTQLTMEYLQSLLGQPAVPQVVSESLWHFDDTSNQTRIHHAPQPARWHSADSFFGTFPISSTERAIDPLSGLYIDPSAVSFDSEDSQMILS